MEKSNQTIRIDSIELRDAEYGRHLNDRLESINTNFETIISSDYLRGDDGVSVGVEPWVINTANLTSEEQTYIDQIIGAILKLNTGSGENEQLVESIKEYLNGKTIHLIKKETGELLSSLPFTYIDSRFSELRTIQDKDLEGMFKDVRDLSCVIHYDNGEFKAIQSFPTIYWDSSLDGGDLCWMINGEKTGLSCRGPQGANGISGHMYTAFYDVNSSMQSVDEQSGEEHVAYHIVAVLTTKKVSSESKYENEYVYADEFSANGIDLNTGDTVIGIPCKFSNKNGVKTITVAVDNVDNGLTVTDKTSTKYTISTVYVDQSTNDIYKKYVIVSDGKSVEIPLILENAHLDDLLKNAKLLYVPAKKDGEEIVTGHAIWNERSGDNNNMCLGTIDNPTDVNKSFLPTSEASVTVKNDVFNVGSNDCLVTKTQADGKNLHIEQSANVAASQPVTVHNFDVIHVGELPTYYEIGAIGIGSMTFGKKDNFASCQFVEIKTPTSKYGKYYTVVNRKLEGGYVDLFIQWESFESFVEFVEDFREFLNSITPEDTRRYELPVKLGKLENLRRDESYNMWFADSFTDVNETTLNFGAEMWINASSNAFSVGHVNNIKLADNGYFDYEIYWYHSSETSIVKSPILFNIEEYKIPTSLPIKRRSESNDVDEVLYIAKNANSWTDIIVPNIEITGDVNQNEMLPYPAKRTKKYVNAGYYGKLIQDFDKYEGKFRNYDINADNCNIKSGSYDVQSSEYKVNVTGTHRIEGQTSLITTTNHYVDVDSLRSTSNVSQQYFGESRRCTVDVWTDNDNQSICGFNGKLLNYELKITVTDEDRVDHAADVVWKYPLMDMGDGFSSDRFRSVFSFVGGSFFIDKVEYAYLMVYSDNLQNLYKFFDLMRNRRIYPNELESIGVKIGLGGEEVKIGLSLAKIPYSMSVTMANEINAQMTRNYSNRFFNGSIIPYVWDLKYGSEDRPVIISVSPNSVPYVLCRAAYDTELYNVFAIDKSTEYETCSLKEYVFQSAGLDSEPNTIYYSDINEFVHQAIPQSKLYESDGSADRLRADKIVRFCNEYNINGINLLDKIAELEARIKTLENNN